MEQCTFERAVLAYINEKQLIQAGDRVIAAASGGADSMALLQFLFLHAEALGITVEAVHVDHRLRQDSATVADDVAAFCKTRNIVLHRFVADAPIAHRSEDWSRQLRYGFFEQLAAPNVRIATAHTQSDQAETLLFRLARGTGTKGAGGIPAKRGVYIRPMLTVTKQMAEDYCALHAIRFFVDPDNFSNAYARTRIRHEALPALEASVPGAQAQMQRFCERMQSVDQYLQQQGEQLLQAALTPNGYRQQTLLAAHPVECEQALTLLVQQKRPLREGDLQALQALLTRKSAAVQLCEGAILQVENGCLGWQPTQPLPTQEPLPPQPLLVGETCLAGGFCLRIRLLEGRDCEETIKFAQNDKKVLNNCADYDKISDSLSLRTRQPGDTFCLPGRNVSKTLKKLFNEVKIPANQRSLLPLVAAGNRVVWLSGFGFEAGLRPDASTKRLLCIESTQKNAKTEEVT